ncbi:MAG: hypothetical protein HW384_2132 [Dehalococcoidia bacterium]|nr:hypothetical protein [Dehalococcoidia bacterium]MBF8304663.1 hypothetical protein [Dehalococcoidia bacterium]
MRIWVLPFIWLSILLIVTIGCTPGGSAPPDKLSGVLNGSVTIGPLCPVEPCSNPIGEVYSSRVLLLKQGNREITRLPLQPDGNFNATVPAGVYSIELSECTFMGCSRALPIKTVVEPEKTTTVQIDIDTGIRSPGGAVSPKSPTSPIRNSESLAPIDGVEILIRESSPPQYAVLVKSGLPDSCNKFGRLEWKRSAENIQIEVFNLIPDNRNMACAQVYGMVENTIELGTDFGAGKTYTVKVNNVIKTFIAR